MYCETDRGSQVDHGRPKSLAPGLTFAWHNHIWACAICNQQKMTRYDPAMIDPTVDDPLRYLDLVPSGRWDPEDEDEGGRGQATIDALPMLNHPDLVEERLQGRARLLRRLSALAGQASVSAEELDMLRAEVTNDPLFGRVRRATRLRWRAARPSSAARSQEPARTPACSPFPSSSPSIRSRRGAGRAAASPARWEC